MKGKRPGASLRADMRQRKRIISEGLPPVKVNSDVYRGWISFSSWTFRHVDENTRATTFVVHTKRPIRWGEAIERITEALSDLLVPDG